MSSTSTGIDPDRIPPEVNRWNWGAFLLNWIWGIGNNTYIALLALIPFVGFIMMLVLGAKGSRWAWRNGRWESVAHFKRVQRAWAIWGFVIWIVVFAFGGGMFGGILYLLGHSEAYQLSVSKLQASPIAASALGTPISTGTPFGSISISGSSGTAALSYSATGTKAKGTVYVDAIKKDGVWTIRRLTLKVDGHDEVIDLISGTVNNST
jgi:hypothetical protein